MQKPAGDGFLTVDGFWAILRSYGVTKVRVSAASGSVICQNTRTGMLLQVLNPEDLTSEERKAELLAFRFTYGVEHH